VSIIKFIWSSSQNNKKLSKHLTVKNVYFENWIEMSKLFYQLFSHIWNETYNWITSDKLIDFQIIKKHTSLRMVGSSKINGSVLTLDNNFYKFIDSLIRIPNNPDAQILTIENHRLTNIVNTIKLSESSVKNMLSGDLNSVLNIKDTIIHKLNNNTVVSIKPAYNEKIYKVAFKMINSIQKNVFKMGKINGEYMTLLRMVKANCIVSDRIHESENSFMHIVLKNNMYHVYFGCYRHCSNKSTIDLGTFHYENEKWKIIINDYESNLEKDKLAKIKKSERNDKKIHDMFSKNIIDMDNVFIN
jgi:hypothetical protein